VPRHYAFLALAVAAIGVNACGRASASKGPAVDSVAATETLGIPGAANSTPVLAASGPWVVAVWTAIEHERTNVYAATSADGAVRFSSPVRVNDVDGEGHVYGEDPPRVAIGPPTSGTTPPEIIVTWPSERTKHLGLRSARSLDGGRTFLPSVSIGDEAIVGERGFQSVTVGVDHVVRAVWLDQRRDPGTPPHKNVEGDWDPMHLMFASANDGRWSAETRLATDVCGCCKTAIATSKDGTIYVAFRNIYPGSLRDISFTLSRDNGRTFSPPVRVSEDHWQLNGCPDDGPTIALDGEGVVHLVWPTLVQGEQPAIGLFHASTRDGRTFTPRQRIETLGTSKPSHPQMTLDRCGALQLAWDEAQDHRRVVAMRQLTPQASGNVEPGSAHVISGSGSAVYPVLAPIDGGVLAAWTEVGQDTSMSRIAVTRVGEHCRPVRDTASGE